MTGPRRLSFGPSGPIQLVVIGAHADDIEIGAGGTILRLLAERPGSTIRWLVASATPERAREARASAAAFSADAGHVDVTIGDLQDGRLPSSWEAVKDMLEALKGGEVDLILAPSPDDAHQDHRVVAETVWQTFRHHLIASYEIPKYDGDLGRPNLFVDLDEGTLRRKVELLEEHYPSQHGRTWWGASTIEAIARLRGIEAATHFAEGLFCRKIVV